MVPSKYPLVLLILVSAFWVWSGIEPQDTRLNWALETLPFLMTLPILREEIRAVMPLSVLI